MSSPSVVTNCLSVQSYGGYDLVYNVCTGTITKIPWGSMYYFGGILAIVSLVGFVYFLYKVA